MRAHLIGTRAFLLAAALGFTLVAPSGAGAAPTLVAGDQAATVTLNGTRPISSTTNRVVAFKRGSTLYVSADELTRVVMGSVSHDGDHYTFASFKGMSNSRTATFLVGSTNAAIDGKAITLTAPPVLAYGRLYIPLSFFGSPGLRTKVAIAPNALTGTIMLPREQ